MPFKNLFLTRGKIIITPSVSERTQFQYELQFLDIQIYAHINKTDFMYI